MNLLAATDLILEQTWLQPKDFKTQLCSRLVFDGFQDGKAKYSYIRKLRNAVVRRGLDITSAGHFDDNFPMFLAESKVQNSKRTKTFVAFGESLLDVIEKCESVVG